MKPDSTFGLRVNSIMLLETRVSRMKEKVAATDRASAIARPVVRLIDEEARVTRITALR